jgi:predicted small secreted protein
MNWKTFLLGVGAGLIAGYAAKELLDQNKTVSPEKVLEHVKSEFKKQGPISGSWIHMKTEPYEKKMLHYNVYKGGISRTANGKTEQIEFIADASTGAILDVYQIS